MASFLTDTENAHGAQGTWLRAVLERFLRGECTWGKDAAILDGRVIFAYPKVFAGLGMEPAALRNQLNDAGWLVVDSASQRLVVEVDVAAGKINGSFGSDGFTGLVKELLALKPDLIRPLTEEPDNGNATFAIPAVITGSHLPASLREVSAPLRIALKRQVHALLRAAKVNAKSDTRSLADFLRVTSKQREIPKNTLFVLLSATPNPLLVTIKDNMLVNADYSEKDNLG